MKHFKVYPLEYKSDLTHHYEALSGLPNFVLLESSDQRIGRYDILSACPYDVFEAFDDKLVFEELKKRLPSYHSDCDLPFQGGAIGFFSYDFGATKYGIKTPAHPALRGLPMAYFCFYSWAIITDHYKQSVHLVVRYETTEPISFIKEIISLWTNTNLSRETFTLTRAFQPTLLNSSYQKSFMSIQRHLVAGRAYQVNFTQSFLASYEGNPWKMYRHIREHNPVPFSAFLRTQDSDVLSFSPERFLLIDDRYLLSSPIKGSAKRSEDPEVDNALQQALLASTKNRAENVMIVDLMRNDLGKIASPGTVNVVSLCELQSFNSVHHLVSHIEAQRKEELDAFDVFDACFPGGSITGAPKREAMRIVAEEERYARGIYCGSIGYFSVHGRCDSNIAIRTAVARKGGLHLSAGGGIVLDSNAEEEYIECYTKIKAIMDALSDYA